MAYSELTRVERCAKTGLKLAEFLRLAMAFKAPLHVEGIHFHHQRHLVNLPTHRRVTSQDVDVEAIVSAVASAAMMVRGGRGHDADMAQRLLGGYTLFVLAK